MPALILGRLAQAILVMLVVGLVAFCMFRFVGDPIVLVPGQDATTKERKLLRHELGLDRPVLLQHARFLQRAARRGFGLSLCQLRPVSTLDLSFASAMLALLGVGIPLGIDTALSRFRLVASLPGVSPPTNLTGNALLRVFAIWLGWLPSFGRRESVAVGLWKAGLLTMSAWKALVPPGVTLIMRLVRAKMLEVLRSDYIRFAKARGVRDTLVRVITVTAARLGSVIARAIITETVFQSSGVGLPFIAAGSFSDLPALSAYLCLIALFPVTINLLLDLLYPMMDPRVRLGGLHTTF